MCTGLVVWCVGYAFSLGYFHPGPLTTVWLLVVWPYELGCVVGRVSRRVLWKQD